VTQINKGDLYVYTDGGYMGLFMVTPKGVIVVDSPPSSNSNGNSILASIANYTNKPVKWVIYSHHHLDHVGSMAIYPDDAEYICHKDAADKIKGAGLPECTRKIKDEYDLKVDDQHLIQLRYHGPIHTPGNLYLYVPKDKLLMLADFVFPQWGPYGNLGMQSSLLIYDQHFKIVLDYDFEYYVGGHVDRIGSRDDVKTGRQFWWDLIASIKQGYQTVSMDDIVKANGGFNGTNTFTIYRAYSNAVDQFCINNMLNTLGWAKKLIDAAAFMETHCFLTYEYVGINY
jgi:glyoxylase-like metal-dependent hydrolase (beta-lactamase superfamily II)